MLHTGESRKDFEAYTTTSGSHSSRFGARPIYFALLQNDPDELAILRSRRFLTEQLNSVAAVSSDLPETWHGLRSWSQANSKQVGQQYRQYLAERKAGAARRYFTNKAHALYFLRAVAPTKLVDGAWLYGLLQRWNEPRFLPLIQTYLEELGEGAPDKNHVVLYRKLLAAHGCQQWSSVGDANFVQGAIQLSLAQHTGDFLPEVIGYNLGYEQLPLHLLICAHELDELGIDPYYFTLHVTVDNAASGHAMQAVDAVLNALPVVSDKDAFYRRVVSGYTLNTLGAGTTALISQFDLDQEVLAVISAKAGVGAQLHSDYCKIAGKTVNEWLSNPAQLSGFLEALQANGWIKQHERPENSRFWQLIEGEKAQMFGVFNAYEKQVIFDWIQGDGDASRLRPLRFRVAQRLENSTVSDVSGSGADLPASYDDFDQDVRELVSKLAAVRSRDEAMERFINLMSPVHHHTEAGLMATRLFSRHFLSA